MSLEDLDFLDPLKILNYLDRCCGMDKATVADVQREVNKIKNLVEEHYVAEFRQIFNH